MKNLLLSCIILIFSLSSFSQNFILKINSTDLPYDTLYLQSFDGKNEYENLLAIPYTEQAVMKQKKPLAPGEYRICGDHETLFNLLISREDEEHFNVNIDKKGTAVFENNAENNNYIAFNQVIDRYHFQSDSINNIFEQARRTMPSYMLQRLADSLIPKADALLEAEDAYKLRVVAENPGTLLAAIASFARVTAPAPRAYYQNKNLLIQYYMSHQFEHFPFEDSRMYNSTLLSAKLLEWCKMLLELNETDKIQAINKLLNKAQANPTIYNTIFDKIESLFGTIFSPLWNENLYLSMLGNALEYKDLSDGRAARYQLQHNLYSKNREGEKVPDFPILLADGTKTSLYNINAEYLIIYFQNPDCPSCTELREKIAVNEDLNRALDNGKLKLITIYFEKDEELWRRYLSNKANPRYMHGWDYSNAIETEQLYDLRIIPFLFLLDKDKKVIKKDLQGNEISDYLIRLNLL